MGMCIPQRERLRNKQETIEGCIMRWLMIWVINKYYYGAQTVEDHFLGKYCCINWVSSLYTVFAAILYSLCSVPKFQLFLNLCKTLNVKGTWKLLYLLSELPAGLLASFSCKLNTFRKRVKNVVTSKGIGVGIELNMWSVVMWSELKWCMWSDLVLKWSEMQWFSVKFLGIKVPCTLGWPYTEGTWLYCGYFIWVYLVLWLF